VAHPVARRPASGLDWESSGTRALVRGRGELGPQLEALLAVHRWALQRGVTLRLRGLQPSVWRVVTLAGLDQLLAPTSEPPGAPAQELALF
jgi:hypothetical protein